MNVDSLNRIGISFSLLYAAKIGTAGVAGGEAESAQAKRLRELQDGLKRLNALPSISASAKQVKANRIGLLKQRLEALKAMLRFASPEQVKAIAQEVRAIARELASIAKSVAADSNAAAPGAAAIDTTANSAKSAPDAQNDAGATTTDTPTGGADAAPTSAQATGVGTGAVGKVIDEHSAQGDGDAGLRALLKDAEKLLKEVIGVLKAKVAMAGKAAGRDLDAAEKSLAEMAGALSQTGSMDLYTSQGELSSGVTAEAAIRSVRV